MFFKIEKPYIKAYIDNKDNIRYVAHIENRNGIYEPTQIGEQLIAFILADLGEYKAEVNKCSELAKGYTKSENDEFTMFTIEQIIQQTSNMLFHIHPIACFYLQNKLKDIEALDKSKAKKLELSCAYLRYILVLQEIFQNGLMLCCDIDYDAQGVTASGRFLGFMGLYPDFADYRFITGVGIAPNKNGKIDFEATDNMKGEDKHSLKQQMAWLKEIDEVSPTGANIVPFTLLKDFSDFLFFEFTELVKRGLRIRKCRNCGKYFVLRSKHQTYYCNRIVIY